MVVKGNKPLMEIIAKKLSGIEGVPPTEQRKMVNRACKSAQAYYDEQVTELRDLIQELVSSIPLQWQLDDDRIDYLDMQISKEDYFKAKELLEHRT